MVFRRNVAEDQIQKQEIALVNLVPRSLTGTFFEAPVYMGVKKKLSRIIFKIHSNLA
jgi:hypothetical protein